MCGDEVWIVRAGHSTKFNGDDGCSREKRTRGKR